MGLTEKSSGIQYESRNLPIAERLLLDRKPHPGREARPGSRIPISLHCIFMEFPLIYFLDKNDLSLRNFGSFRSAFHGAT